MVAANRSSERVTKKANEEGERKRGEEKTNFSKIVLEVGGGEENERQMENNVMREMRVYDGYLVCLDLA